MEGLQKFAETVTNKTGSDSKARRTYRTDFENFKRAVSPFEVYRKRRQLDAMANGTPLNIFDQQVREQLRTDYADADIDTVCSCEQVSQMTHRLCTSSTQSSADLAIPSHQR